MGKTEWKLLVCFEVSKQLKISEEVWGDLENVLACMFYNFIKISIEKWQNSSPSNSNPKVKNKRACLKQKKTNYYKTNFLFSTFSLKRHKCDFPNTVDFCSCFATSEESCICPYLWSWVQGFLPPEAKFFLLSCLHLTCTCL